MMSCGAKLKQFFRAIFVSSVIFIYSVIGFLRVQNILSWINYIVSSWLSASILQYFSHYSIFHIIVYFILQYFLYYSIFHNAVLFILQYIPYYSIFHTTVYFKLQYFLQYSTFHTTVLFILSVACITNSKFICNS